MRRFIYQVYPVSFMDSNGDGYGDIRGLTSRLGHIRGLGVDYVWLSPVFTSPMRDNGYDVADYVGINPLFGTTKDLQELVQKADAAGMGVMLDMVFNHTSTEHEWFKKWRSGDPEYADFYYELPSKPDGSAPTNWLSKFGGIAWEQHRPGWWYLHLFHRTQADLNWSNPRVREKLFEVLRHYQAMGVRGFRFDVINLIDKSFFVDDTVGDGRLFYTDGVRVHEYMNEIRRQLPSDPRFLTVGEASSVQLRDALSYANKDRTELDELFMFHHLKVDYVSDLDKFAPARPDIRKLHDVLARWYTAMHQAGSKLANFWNNHDQPRSASRFVAKPYHDIGAKMLFALAVCLPGDVYVYQGEEIAMANPDFADPADYRDVETLNYLQAKNLTTVPAAVMAKSRDASRTPMQWDGSANAGFTKGRPWMRVPAGHEFRNVARAEAEKGSVLHFYREAIAFGRDEFLERSDIAFVPYQEGLIRFTRSAGSVQWRCTFSFGEKSVRTGVAGRLLWSNYASFDGVLQPYQFVVELV